MSNWLTRFWAIRLIKLLIRVTRDEPKTIGGLINLAGGFMIFVVVAGLSIPPFLSANFGGSRFTWGPLDLRVADSGGEQALYGLLGIVVLTAYLGWCASDAWRSMSAEDEARQGDKDE